MVTAYLPQLRQLYWQNTNLLWPNFICNVKTEASNIIEKGAESQAFSKAVYAPNVLEQWQKAFIHLCENNGNLNQANPEFVKL